MSLLCTKTPAIAQAMMRTQTMAKVIVDPATMAKLFNSTREDLSYRIQN